MGRTFTKKLLCFGRTIWFALWLAGAMGLPVAVKGNVGKVKTHQAAIDQTITFNPINSKTYTDADFSPGATASSGLQVTYISSDVTVARVVNGGTMIRIVGAGTAVITAEQPGNAEYNRAPRESQTLTVNKADLIITAVSQTRTYGSNNATLNVTYSGLRTGETALNPRPTISTTATTASNVGDYNIVVNGGTSNNYNITRVNGTITITPANLTIRADNKTKAYGAANPTLTVTYAGFRNNDTFTKLTTRPVISTTAVRYSEPGVYPITASGASSNNYNIRYTDGTLTINRTVLTITVASKTKVYGGTVPALTYTIAGFAPGQTEASLTSPVVISTTATRNSPVGSYPITASGAASDNYDIRYVQSTLRVTKAALTVTAVNATRVYGSDNPEFALTYRGFVLGETAEDLTTQPVVATTATAASRATTYSIRASGATSDNYNFNYVAGILTVTKAPLRIVAEGKTRAYGEANPELTLTYTGFVNGEDEDILTTKPTVSTTATVRSAVGRYPITPRAAAAQNYTITYGNGALVIGKADLTITANDITRLYGASSPGFTVTYDGFANGETVTVLTKRPTLTSPGTSISPAGTYTITPAGATATNYNLIYETGTLTIGKRTLTITAADKSRAYGQANPALTATYVGLVNNDRVAIIFNGDRPELSTGATPASEPGTYPIEISGNLTADNYEVVLVNGTLTVGNATLTITANSTSKTYGQAIPRLSYTITGYVNGDNRDIFSELPTPPVTTATAESPAGTYNITTGGAVVNSTYYNLRYVTGKLTVNKALLSVRVANKTRIYGEPNPEFTYTITGFVNNDTREEAVTREPTVTTTATETTPVGNNYNIQGRSATADNYTFSYITGKLTITPAALVIKANDTTRRYGQPNPEFTATYTGLTSFDTPASLITPPAFSTTATQGSIPGDYPITVSGAASPNYTITYAGGTLNIGRPLLTVKANNQLRNYGADNPALTLTYSGFLNGDDESIFTTLPSVSTTATVASNTGNYDITVSGGANPAYDLAYEKGTLTINKVDLTVKANDASRAYGVANPAFGVSYSGFVNNDTEAALATQPIVSTTATPTSALGTYALVPAGGASPNYNFNYVNGTLTVTPGTATISFAAIPAKTYGNTDFDAGATNNVNEPLIYASDNAAVAVIVNNKIHITGAGTAIITASLSPTGNYSQTAPVSQTLTVNKAPLSVKADNQSKTYGDANPAFTVGYSGFVNGETTAVLTSPSTASTTVTTSSNVGTYSIVPSGGAAANYELTYTNGTLTIGKAVLTATAQNASRIYGQANPVFGVTYSGFLNGDNETAISTPPLVSTAATATSPVGTYVLVPTGGVSTNYSFTYANGTLTITPATAIITFASLPAKTYGNTDFDGGATNTVGETITYSSNNLAVATIVNNKIHITGAGIATITAAFPASGNYSQTQPVSQALTVNKAPLNVKADDKTKVYGTANPALTVTYSGFVNNESQSVLTSASTVTTTATIGSGVGNYAITPSGGAANNYEFIYTNGTLAVTKATLTITAQNATRAYGAANPAFAVTYTGFVNGDDANALTTKPTVSTSATPTSLIGTYPLAPSGAVSANYDFSYVNGTLTITGGAATITFAPLPAKTFGDADFDAGATNNVGETIVYTSSNTAIATIVNGRIRITGAGTAVITASFPAGSGYSQTQPQTQLLVVNKAQQVITFAAIPLLSRGEVYSLQNVTASSGLPVSFTVVDAAIASVQAQGLTAKQIGSTTVTATQPGNNNYMPATAVTRPLEIINVDGKIEVEVHTGVSPNGDGINDVFFIEGITKYPNNRVTLYNRNGIKVWEAINYNNTSIAFSGRSSINGQMLQPGTYFYIIEFIAGDKGRKAQGALMLKYQ